jgi:hypothetical protein
VAIFAFVLRETRAGGSGQRGGSKAGIQKEMQGFNEPSRVRQFNTRIKMWSQYHPDIKRAPPQPSASIQRAG